MHDWSHLSFKHTNKTDTYAITHETDVGYDLQTSLIVSDQKGQPLAQRLVSADGSYATYGEPGLPVKPPRMGSRRSSIDTSHTFILRRFFNQKGVLVPLIDREGGSEGHVRRWLVRVKDNPNVDCQGKPMACKAVAQELAFSKTRQVSYHGQTYWRWVAETDVTLTRPAKQKGIYEFSTVVGAVGLPLHD